MAFKPNYQQQRGDRNRAKEQKKQERLRRRTEDAERRKAEREGVPGPDGETAAPETPEESD
jgi:hypothetical protein